MSDALLVSVPNVSAPCLGAGAPPPCLCPVYGPGGIYLPTETASGVWECRLALEAPPPLSGPVPVPSLDEWAVIVLVALLALVGARRAR